MTGSEQPSRCYVVTTDGETVECLLELIEPLKWQAVPVRNIAPWKVDRLYIDVLPPGGSVEFAMPGSDAT